MALSKSKENLIKRLIDQQSKHNNNPKMVTNLQKKINTLKNTK